METLAENHIEIKRENKKNIASNKYLSERKPKDENTKNGAVFQENKY